MDEKANSFNQQQQHQQIRVSNMPTCHHTRKNTRPVHEEEVQDARSKKQDAINRDKGHSTNHMFHNHNSKKNMTNETNKRKAKPLEKYRYGLCLFLMWLTHPCYHRDRDRKPTDYRVSSKQASNKKPATSNHLCFVFLTIFRLFESFLRITSLLLVVECSIFVLCLFGTCGMLNGRAKRPRRKCPTGQDC